ncbi:MAG: hypothetical protein J7L26_10685 [Candidatus Aminicenantes bacterium]|nr:hypothetical protein [Candidatus Aminicenantes bacterium]
MNRKVLSIIGVLIIFLAFQSCASKPEQTLLKRYFDAVSLKDTTTMSTMALEPVSIDFASWEIIAIGEETVEPFKLPEMDKKEQELKKKVEESVGITLDARDALDEAKFELENARTRSARRAARKKVEEMQKKYDEQYEKHKNLQKEYNEAKAAAAREEEIATFSLGTGELPTIRTFTGQVRFKTVDVAVKQKDGESKTYRFYLRKYDLTDESLGRHYRGRWIIERIEEVK